MLGLGVEVVTVVNESYLLLRRPIIVSILRILSIIYILYSTLVCIELVCVHHVRERVLLYSRSFKAYESMDTMHSISMHTLVVEYEFAPILYPGGSNLTAGKCPNIYY